MSEQRGGFRMPAYAPDGRVNVNQVPSWTGEDETNLRRRVEALNTGVVDKAAVYAVLGVAPPTTITMALDLGIGRRRRGRCLKCRLRRVLYAIVVTGNAFGGSEPRCAACWGIRGS